MKRSAAGSLLLFALASTGCWKSEPPLVVGSKGGTEQAILGEIIAQHLERRVGEPVTRRIEFGPTELLHTSLQNGDVDVYPEYTGTALRQTMRLTMTDYTPDLVFARVSDIYRNNFRVEVFPPLGFESKATAAVLAVQADARHLATLSDAAADKRGWQLAFCEDFANRLDGLPALTSVYRVALRGLPMRVERRDLYSTLRGGQADMVMVRTTDAGAGAPDVRLLDDDKGAFPPYQAVILARASVLEARPKLRDALRELSGKIGHDVMRRMNTAVDRERKQPVAVAAEFLAGLR